MINIKESIILNTDSYKHSMYKQYPIGTTHIYDYIEPRIAGKEVLVLGLQAFIKEYLLKPITQEDIDSAYCFATNHGIPFNKPGWEYILYKHNGFLPLMIRAVPEGSIVPTQNVIVTVENTDPNVPWITTHIETALLRAIWYPTTVATISKNIKNIILKYLEETGTPETISYKLHDFGARGASSYETAGLGGMAHLINFNGSDTITGNIFANKYYYGGYCSNSIPAMEHTSVILWGQEKESEAYQNMINQYKDYPFVACVSDAYDIYNAVANIWGDKLKDDVISNSNNGSTLVIRPDSGNPVDVICGSKDFFSWSLSYLTGNTVDVICGSKENKGLINILWDKFGGTINEKGYKVLNNVRLIQGDGVDAEVIEEILSKLKYLGYSADNISFGMGGALLQKLDRDTYKFAMKCSEAIVNGEPREVAKNPITDKGKQSKKGRVTLVKLKDGTIKTMTFKEIADNPDIFEKELLQDVYYRNGTQFYFNDISFDKVKNNSLQKL